MPRVLSGGGGGYINRSGRFHLEVVQLTRHEGPPPPLGVAVAFYADDENGSKRAGCRGFTADF